MIRNIVILLTALAIPSLAAAQPSSYPSKPITVVVPFGPGSAVDTQVRLLARKLPSLLNGTAIVVENRPGANSQLGIEYAARQSPDGYTLVAITGSIALLPVMNPTFKIDPAKGLTHIVLFSRGPQVVTINNTVPANNLTEFVEYARANPGKVRFGTAGLGDRSIGEYFAHAAGIKLVTVPFNSVASPVPNLINNDVQVVMSPALTVKGFVKDGKAKALAVSTAKRTELVPGVPTVAESGYPGFDFGFWFGLSGPPGMPREIVDRLNGAVLSALKDTEVIKGINISGSDAIGSTPEELAAAIESDRSKLSDVARAIMTPAQ
jgi:tripartite-type tricarboxylate transporter receptor subunit TctC